MCSSFARIEASTTEGSKERAASELGQCEYGIDAARNTRLFRLSERRKTQGHCEKAALHNAQKHPAGRFASGIVLMAMGIRHCARLLAFAPPFAFEPPLSSSWPLAPAGSSAAALPPIAPPLLGLSRSQRSQGPSLLHRFPCSPCARPRAWAFWMGMGGPQVEARRALPILDRRLRARACTEDTTRRKGSAP